MNGIVIREADKFLEHEAARRQLAIMVSATWTPAYDGTLFVAPGTRVPVDLIEAGFRLLARWDVAAPFWRYGILAQDTGTPAERARTEAVIRDLRVPLYAHELLFVRKSAEGLRFLAIWRTECDGGDERLAFLRALYLVKPIFCALPRSWLAEIQARTAQDARVAKSRNMSHQAPLVKVQIGANSFVTCREGDEAATLARFQRMKARNGHAG